MTAMDRWFLEQVKETVDYEAALKNTDLESVSTGQLLVRNASGFPMSTSPRSGASRNLPCAKNASRWTFELSLAVWTPVRRVREFHALSVLLLRKRLRGGSEFPQEGHDPGQRAQSHRTRHRV